MLIDFTAVLLKRRFMKNKDFGIYIHIPYCERKCNYCDFKSYSGIEHTMNEYFKVLNKEIIYYSDQARAPRVRRGNVADTIFIGGGTPSIVDARYIDDILNTIYKNYELSKDTEITIECNPGTVTEEKLKSYKMSGINRISFGLQSAVDSELKLLGRIHDFNDYVKSMNIAVKTGFKNINTDIIIGIPGQTIQSLTYTLEKVCDMPNTHISAYSLIIEEDTNFYDTYRNGTLNLPEEEYERQLYDHLLSYLKNKGFSHYEISNFAKGYDSLYECKHNLKYWQAKEYLGFGLGAHSYFKSRRYWNYDDMELYLKNKTIKGYEPIDNSESMKEFMMLGFRMIKGVRKAEFKKRYLVDMTDIFQEQIKKLLAIELIEEDDKSIKLTRKGLDFANVVFREFI